jgi:hypothetical protein
MSYVVSGLPLETFRPLFGLSDEALAARGILRRTADSKPGFPCRVTLRDAEPGDTLLLMNYESHSADTPYRSTHAIYVNEAARAPATFKDELPPVFESRNLSLRSFDAAGMLIAAELARGAEVEAAIRRAFDNPDCAYIHAHNAAPGCFSARIDRK